MGSWPGLTKLQSVFKQGKPNMTYNIFTPQYQCHINYHHHCPALLLFSCPVHGQSSFLIKQCHKWCQWIILFVGLKFSLSPKECLFPVLLQPSWEFLCCFVNQFCMIYNSRFLRNLFNPQIVHKYLVSWSWSKNERNNGYSILQTEMLCVRLTHSCKCS